MKRTRVPQIRSPSLLQDFGGERAFLKQNKVRGLASVKQPIYIGGKEGYLLHLKIWPEDCRLH